MSKAVNKFVARYSLQEGYTVHTMPQSCEILHIGTQHSEMGMWGLVETDDTVMVSRTFFTVVTAAEFLVHEQWIHIGSLLGSGSRLFHVFVCPEYDEWVSSAVEQE